MLHMVTVEFAAGDLGALMAAMRTWLDDRMFEPDTFRYQLGAEPAAIYVEFKIEAEARAFAERFQGELASAGRPLGEEGLRSEIAA
jgi:hypothetical protein